MNEQLSAFLDNEATRDESDSVVNALLRDKTLRDSWTRQHWIRTTLRAHSAETPVAVDTGFADRVMKAIAEEDHPETVATPPLERSNVVALPRANRTRRWRGMAGFAAAASVAGVVFLAGQPLLRNGSNTAETRVAANNAGTTSTRTRDAESSTRQGFGSGRWNDQLADFSSVSAQPGQVETVASASPSTVALQSAQRRTTRMTDGAADHWSVSDPAVRDELNGYLVDHNGMARGYGMSSTTPALIRVSSYGQDVAQ
ncbi:sigma-E factor negative regulatory protein [Salinisphaera sp. SPP-AMP-43]|uniref:sigma-E factor negative regulatory protein n=1 Tax=Salinisphaera sp. SPP-AMP-43 TaxID=3121288 RepID=UPI003C6E6775